MSLASGDILNVLGVHTITNLGDGLTPYTTELGYFLVGGQNCGFYNITQGDVTVNSRKNIKCRVDNAQQLGEYNFTENVKYGFANITIKTYFTSLFTLNVYMVRILGQVKNISIYHRGGSLGHQLSLIGSGFITDV